MCKYDMDPASIVEDTEQTRFDLQMDRQMEGRMDLRTDKVKPVYPLNFVGGGYNKLMWQVSTLLVGSYTVSDDFYTQYTCKLKRQCGNFITWNCL